MSKIRIATFNLENLLQRFNFSYFGRSTTEPVLQMLGIEKTSNGDEYTTLRRSLHVNLTDDSRQMTAQAIQDTNADLICLQEVDNCEILDAFHEQYLKKSTGVNYGWRRVIEGNDRRGINVGIMSKQKIRIESHADLTFEESGVYTTKELQKYSMSGGARIFRRDCLEVETKVGNTELAVFVCHFKSMSGGRSNTRHFRYAEAAAVRQIIMAKYANPAQEPWLVVGDLNDYVENSNNGATPEHGLEPLLNNGFAVNLVARRPVDDQWTHYYTKDQTKRQLDYILASPCLAKSNKKAVPDILRRGQPWRIPGLESLQRYPRVGFDRPKASDHCAVAVTLDV